MLTLFTVPKPFSGRIEIIQRNAIKSWTLLEPTPEIIVLGNEPGTEEVVQDFNLRHVPGVKTNKSGTPLLNDIFDRAMGVSNNNLLCYINADIILMGDFICAIEMVKDLERFMMVGLRWKLTVDEYIDFNNKDWDVELTNLLEIEGERETYIDGGEDYFAFNRGLMENIPPFAIGRMHWDSWLLYQAKQSGASLVDVTEVVTAIHQNHDYSNLGGIQFREIFLTPEAKKNFDLAGGQDYLWYVSDADHVLTHDGLKRAGLKNRTLVRWIKTHFLVNSYLACLFKTLRYLIDIFRPGSMPSYNK
jgi:hypothetical protein